MTAPIQRSPRLAIERAADYPLWSDARGAVEVRFVGRGALDRPRDVTLDRVEAGAPPVAMLRQVHSSRIVEVATPGGHGEGDALITGETDLALSVITADCVPVLVAAGERVAAIHAGWRGIVAGVVPAALAALAAPGGGLPAHVAAWVGPAIGACCYEVGDEVAAQVRDAAGVDVATPGPRGRPHLDLHAAVVAQLARAGVLDVTLVESCTRCQPEELWSYRREGKRAGRNIAYIWRRRV